MPGSSCCSEERDFARGGVDQPRGDLHEGRFARAVLAHKPVDVARAHVHVERIEGVLGSVCLGERVRLEDVHGCLLAYLVPFVITRMRRSP